MVFGFGANWLPGVSMPISSTNPLASRRIGICEWKHWYRIANEMLSNEVGRQVLGGGVNDIDCYPILNCSYSQIEAR